MLIKSAVAHFETFFFVCFNISPSGYKPTQNPLRTWISPGIISDSLRYFKSAVKYIARVLATLRLHGRPGHDGCQSALWEYFGEHNFNMAANLSPKTAPQCTFTTISTRSPAQPQSGEYSFHKLKPHVISRHAYETTDSAYWGVVKFADQYLHWGLRRSLPPSG